jgi:hypothetical protein
LTCTWLALGLHLACAWLALGLRLACAWHEDLVPTLALHSLVNFVTVNTAGNVGVSKARGARQAVERVHAPRRLRGCGIRRTRAGRRRS